MSDGDRTNPNTGLIGRKDARTQLDTPCLVIDLPTLKSNIARGAELAQQAGKRLRPHLKAHKCPRIAKLQEAEGASGFSVATVGEAEVFAAAGFSDLLVTSTFATDSKIDRVIDLLASGHNITIVLDNVDVCTRLADRAASQDVRVPVMIDLDMGRHRSGCPDPPGALRLCQAILSRSALALVGVQAYAGQLSHEGRYEDRVAGAKEAQRRLRQSLEAIRQAFRGSLIVSGGSTGASRIDAENPLLTELQWGSYPVMDLEYLGIDWAPHGGAWPFELSLFVATRVISANADDHVTVDAGHKQFVAKYGTEPRVMAGAPSDVRIYPTSDEHGVLCHRAALGHLLEVAVPHCDPTVNLYNEVHVVNGAELLDIWPITARGVF